LGRERPDFSPDSSGLLYSGRDETVRSTSVRCKRRGDQRGGRGSRQGGIFCRNEKKLFPSGNTFCSLSQFLMFLVYLLPAS
jgi:hypothetical protein